MKSEAYQGGVEAAEADFELGPCDTDPWPDDCPEIQSDVEIADWREGYLDRAAKLASEFGEL